MAIREAHEDDWPRIWPIIEDVITEQQTFAYDPAMSEDDAKRGWLLSSPARVVVAVAGGQVLGTANMYANRPGPGSHVASGSLMVARGARGQGVGRALTADMIRWAGASGFAAIQFNAVVETNTPAVRLYESLGFVTLGTAPGAFRHPVLGPVGLRIMWLDLRHRSGREREVWLAATDRLRVTNSAVDRGLVRATGVVVETRGVEFFCYHRDRPGSVTMRAEMREEHWSYMDRYAAEMIARGPTFAGDGGTPTGSVHVLTLPSPAAARAFAFDEPNYQAGVYRDVMLRRWRNLLGRTMWDFPGGGDGGNRYLVLGLGVGQAEHLAVPPGRDELIAYGPLLSDNGATWLGTAVLVRAPDPARARAVLTPGRYASVEVHDWRFGGRPS